MLSGCGRLGDGYRGGRTWMVIVFRGVDHVEVCVTLAATSDDDQRDDRGNHEGEDSEDDTNDDHCDVGAACWWISIASALSWYGSVLGACLRGCDARW